VFHVKQEDGGPRPIARPDLPPDAEQRLTDYADLLRQWNARINLVADASPEVIRHRHVEDCLQLAPLLPEGDITVADLGSGAGLPGLILAIARPVHVHLVESDRRKAAFLTDAAARLGLTRVTVHSTRIEAASLPPIQVVTARALAPLASLLPRAARLLTPGGIALFPKGRSAQAELTAAAAAWTFRAEPFASRTDPEATILRFSDIRRAGTQS
jgi:16S rRNA (guanine527-N7)-methyltransferase